MSTKIEFLLAERVMDWQFWDMQKGDWDGEPHVIFFAVDDPWLLAYRNNGEHTQYWSPLLDIGDAWEIQNRMVELGFHIALYRGLYGSQGKHKYMVTFTKPVEFGSNPSGTGFGKTAQEAISFAALRAVGVTEEEIEAALKL